MKLNDITYVVENKKAMAVLEQRLSAEIDFDSLSAPKATYLSHKVNRLLESYRTSNNRYDSHQDPAYLKLLMMAKALRNRIDEVAPAVAGTAPVAGATAGATAAGSIAATPAQTAATQSAQVAQKKKVIQDQIKAKQKEIQELQKAMNNPTMMETRTSLSESEVQEAQVVLAAQDLVDRVQEMIEDASEMQFKDLPALVDSIRNQVGMDQANAFNATVSSSMQGLITSLQGTKQQLETAVSAATGAGGMTVPGEDMGMMPPAGDLAAPAPAPMPGEEVGELDLDIEEPAKPDSVIGRSKRK